MVDDGESLSLHFEATLVQSRMLKAEPTRLVHAYTRTMMGFLLLVPTPRRIAMIGLGGGSLAKACASWLPDATFIAIECSPEVLALRDTFGIPPDGPRFLALCADGAEWVRGDDEVDVLLVDGFDGHGQPKQLCTTEFYADCYARLLPGGGLVVNLNADETGYGTYVRRIRDAFDSNIRVVRTEDDNNKIVFALKDAAFPSREQLEARAAAFPDVLGAVAARMAEGRRREPLLAPPRLRT